MDAADGRDAFASSLNLDLILPPDDLAVHIDAVLFDPSGYAGRLALWDTPPLTTALASLYAAPAFRVLEHELGAGRVTGVQVWHLRSGVAKYIDSATAAGAMPLAETIVHRIAR
jgi:hypothetical protein